MLTRSKPGATAMDHRFPALHSQHHIDPHAARVVARTLPATALPSLPWGEWLVALVALVLLTSL
jgi:hypothetical protein